MRLIKMLGLAMLTGIVAMAFVAVGTASAAHLEVLCKKDPGKGLCPAGQLYKKGTKVKAKLEPLAGVKHAVLLGNINELCTESIVGGEITKTSKIHGIITEISFTGCEPCTTVTMSNLPYLMEVKHNPEASEHLWTLKVTGSIRAKFTGCPLGVTCTFETKEVLLNANNTATGLPLILTNKNELKRVEGSEFFCGNTGFWDANYLVETPHPSWLALDEKEEA